MLPTVICIAQSQPHAEQIIGRLQAEQVPLSDVSVMLVPKEGTGAPAIKGLSDANKQQIKEDAAAGASAGYMAGAAVGVAALTTPILEVFLLAAAPFAIAAGAALGAAAGAGTGLAGLQDYGIPQAQLDYYQQKMHAGGFLVAVRTDDEAELARAQSVFEKAGAQDIALNRFSKKLT